jgi:hypothetical protein
MGRSYTPTFRVEYNGGAQMCWDSKRDGRPTEANLDAWRDGYNASFQPGGVNGHLAGYRIGAARLVRQATGEVVAEVAAPMFEVF